MKKVPLKLTKAEAAEIASALEMNRRLLETLRVATEAIEQLTTQVASPGDRVITGFSPTFSEPPITAAHLEFSKN